MNWEKEKNGVIEYNEETKKKEQRDCKKWERHLYVAYTLHVWNKAKWEKKVKKKSIN